MGTTSLPAVSLSPGDSLKGLGSLRGLPSRPGPASCPPLLCCALSSPRAPPLLFPLSPPLPLAAPGVLEELLEGWPRVFGCPNSCNAIPPSLQEDDASSLTADNLEKFGKLSASTGPPEDGTLLSEAKLQSIMSFLDEMEKSGQDRPASAPQVWRGPQGGTAGHHQVGGACLTPAASSGACAGGGAGAPGAHV